MQDYDNQKVPTHWELLKDELFNNNMNDLYAILSVVWFAACLIFGVFFLKGYEEPPALGYCAMFAVFTTAGFFTVRTVPKVIKRHNTYNEGRVNLQRILGKHPKVREMFQLYTSPNVTEKQRGELSEMYRVYADKVNSEAVNAIDGRISMLKNPTVFGDVNRFGNGQVGFNIQDVVNRDK